MTDYDQIELNSHKNSSGANSLESGSHSSKEGKTWRSDSVNYDTSANEDKTAKESSTSK